MPQIPEIAYRTTPVGPVNTPRATADVFGGPQAAGLQRLGQTVTQSANVFDQIKDQQDQFEAGLQLVENSQKAFTAFEDAKNSAAPGAPDFTKSVTDQLDKWIPDAISSGPGSTGAQQKLAAGYAQLKSNLIDKAMQFEAQARTAETLRRVDDATDEMANAARADPSLLTTQLVLSDTLLHSAPFMDEQSRAKANVAVQHKIWSAGADGWTTQYETQPVTIQQLETAIEQVKKGEFGFKDNLTPPVYDNVLTRLENRKKQLGEENKQAVLYAIADEKAAIATNGQFTGMVTQKLLADTFPDDPEKAKRIWMDLVSEKRKYGIRVNHTSTSPVEDAAYLQSLQAGVRGEGAQFRREELLEAQQVLAAKYREWATDPVAYQIKNDPSLAQAMQTANQTMDPEANRAVSVKMDAWYDRMGTPSWARQYLGKGAAQTLTEKLNALPAEQAANEMYILKQQDPAKYRLKMRELDKAGLNQSFMVLGRMDSPTEAVGRKKLSEALQVSRDDLTRAIGTTSKADIDSKVLTKMRGYNATLSYAGTQGGRIMSAEMGAMQILSYKILADDSSLSAGDAVDKAYKMLHGTRDYADGYSTPKIPGVNFQGMVEDDHRKAIRDLRPDMFAPAAIPPGTPADRRAYYESPQGIQDRTNAAYEVARRQGVWTDSPDGSGTILMVPDDGSKTGYSPLRTKDGNLYERRFDDVLQHPAPSPTGMPLNLNPDMGGMGYAEEAIRNAQQ